MMSRTGDLAAAIADFTAGRYEAAESACALILDERPDEIDALNLLAVLLCRRQEFDPAIPLLVRVLEAQPDNVTALSTMGDALFVLQEFDGAAECFRRAGLAEPGRGTAWLKQAQALHHAGRYAEAVPCYLESFARGEGRGTTLADLASTLGALGRPADAAAVLRAAAAISPDQAADWAQIEAVLAALGPAAPAPVSPTAPALLAPGDGEIRFVTGTNATMFAQLFPLLQAFDASGRRDRLVVADFGLTPFQRAFLAGRGQLRQSLWSEVEKVHPWWCKAALIDYLAADEAGLIWIDADMFPLKDPQPEVEALLDTMAAAGHTLAAAADSSASIASLLTFSARSGKECTPFQLLLTQYGINLAHPYLNSGFFVARDRAALALWKQIAHAHPTGFLWEQNAFNVMAWQEARQFLPLDPRRWNVHGPLLRELGPCHDGAMICDGEPVTILHATTAEPGPFDERPLRWLADGESRQGIVRWFTRPDLNRHQTALVEDFLAANGWPRLA